MFPTFVTSFQDQFFAVFINLIGTILGSFVTTAFSTVGKGFFEPLLLALTKSLTGTV